MEKGEKSTSSSGLGKEKVVAFEKGKRASQNTKIGIDFDPKTSRLCNHEEVDKSLVK